jgi:hypothetical protein
MSASDPKRTCLRGYKGESVSTKKVIVQFSFADPAELDRWFKIEETLHQAFEQANDGYVDGHEVGEGRFNIYIHVRSVWGPVLERVDAFLRLKGASGAATVVKFHPKTERYEVVRPLSFEGNFSI